MGIRNTLRRQAEGRAKPPRVRPWPEVKRLYEQAHPHARPMSDERYRQIVEAAFARLRKELATAEAP